MARKQKDTAHGQLLPWNAVLEILKQREETHVKNRLHARSKQLIEEMADFEFAQLVSTYTQGG